ncbi:MAG: TonB-dependent receptor [Pseudomonadales bacterium]
MNTKKTALSTAIATAVFAMTGASVSSAQDLVLEEVIVTAQKRAESAQDIPIAVSAFGADFLKKSNVVGVDKLIGFTPGLNGTVGQDAESVITVRGVGTDAFGVGVDNSVGMFIDDVPVGRPTLIGNSFFDLERVEVVKGPQGTLFGRNASAGAISVITNKPNLEENSFELTAGAGNEGQQVYEVTGNLAASDQLAFRLAARHDERDGPFENTVTGDELNNRDHTNIRLGVKYEPTDTLSTFFSAEQVDIDTRVGFSDINVAFEDKTAQNQVPSQDIEVQRYLAKITWDINDTWTLTSNTSFMDYDLIAVPVDVDVSDTFFLQIQEPQEGDQFVQEFRLNGSTDNVDWFVGTSFIRETIESRYSPDYSDFILTQVLLDDFTFCDTSGLTCLDNVEQDHFAETDNTSYALYGDVAWNINDRIKLTFGARYTVDEKEFKVNQPVPNSALSMVTGDALVKLGTTGLLEDDDSWNSFDPRVVLDYKLMDDVLVYGSVSSGYKSGGFNSDPNNTLESGLPQKPASFDEETVLAYEIGLKTQFWDNRAQVNAAIYFNDYEDYQVEAGDFVILIENGGELESKGFELDGTFLLGESLTLMLNYSYLDAEFTNGAIEGIDVSGERLNRAPEHSGAIIVSYGIPIGELGELSVRGDYIYSDSFLFATENPALEQESYGLFNARIGFAAANDRWELALIGENIADEEYFAARSDVLDQNLVVPAMGAMYRAEVTVRF